MPALRLTLFTQVEIKEQTMLYVLLYIDPGVGSTVIQAIIAGTFGFFYVIKMYGHKIKSFFTGRKKNKQ
jgi:hypothetical protein